MVDARRMELEAQLAKAQRELEDLRAYVAGLEKDREFLARALEDLRVTHQSLVTAWGGVL